jgi:hypothetical protein
VPIDLRVLGLDKHQWLLVHFVAPPRMSLLTNQKGQMAWALDSNGTLRGRQMCEPGAFVRRWWLALMRALIEDAWQSGCAKNRNCYFKKPQVYIVMQVYMYWCICMVGNRKCRKSRKQEIGINCFQLCIYLAAKKVKKKVVLQLKRKWTTKVEWAIFSLLIKLLPPRRALPSLALTLFLPGCLELCPSQKRTH